ncbi:hypothetical protein HEP75_04303 [Xanthomonas sp. SI]|nr:hypothetical protein HEP75_04303 [Xanthomonas sp. SI]
MEQDRNVISVPPPASSRRRRHSAAEASRSQRKSSRRCCSSFCLQRRLDRSRLRRTAYSCGKSGCVRPPCKLASKRAYLSETPCRSLGIQLSCKRLEAALRRVSANARSLGREQLPFCIGDWRVAAGDPSPIGAAPHTRRSPPSVPPDCTESSSRSGNRDAARATVAGGPENWTPNCSDARAACGRDPDDAARPGSLLWRPLTEIHAHRALVQHRELARTPGPECDGVAIRV